MVVNDSSDEKKRSLVDVITMKYKKNGVERKSGKVMMVLQKQKGAE